MEIKRYSRLSLSEKITVLIVITAFILGVLASTISYKLYVKNLDSHHISLCNGALNLVGQTISGDELDRFIQDGTETPAYLAMEQRLKVILDSFPEITYLYVYQIFEDHCQVVFDIDTEDLPGETLGTSIDLDASFLPYMSQLLNGESIAPITSNDQYGWLLSVYRPMYDSSGKCVAYAAVDVSMEEVRSDRFIFIIRVISLLTGATILITAFAVWFAQTKLARPINRLADMARSFAYDDENGREVTLSQLEKLQINTGDEIENLSDSITKMVTDMLQYISVINEKSRDIANKAAIISRMQNNIIYAFANMIERRDACTGSHVRHTADYVYAIGQCLYKDGAFPEELSEDYLETLQKSAPLHDVGKIRIPDSILNKPGKLTKEEFDVIKTHTNAGGEILSETLAGLEDQSFLKQAIQLATYHHERWDGKGYPQGLLGNDIPLCARIMAVADVFDALVSKRSYKEPFSFDEAVLIIQEEAGTHFDPSVVDAFLKILPQIHSIANDRGPDV